MLTVNKLEKIIELEDNLRNEWQEKLDAATAEAERYKQELAEQRENMQATIDQQVATIKELSAKSSNNDQMEQRNRELGNRSEKLQEEVSSLKQRVKALQKDLASEREQVKSLTQFDPARMKKNLDTSKKKLAEKTKANEQLQKSLNDAKKERVEQQRKLQSVEEELETLKAELGAEQDADAEKDAA